MCCAYSHTWWHDNVQWALMFPWEPIVRVWSLVWSLTSPQYLDRWGELPVNNTALTSDTSHYTSHLLVFCPRSEIVKMMLFNYRWHGRWSGSGRGYLVAGGWLCLVTHNSRQVWAGQTRPRPGWDQKYDRPLSAAIKTSALSRAVINPSPPVHGAGLSTLVIKSYGLSQNGLWRPIFIIFDTE